MGKKVFILNSDEGDVGVAKIVSNKNIHKLYFSFNKRLPEVKKCHILCNEKEIESFVVKKKYYSEFECDGDIDSIYFTSANDKIIVWSGENKQTEDEYKDFFTFEDFFGGGFEWRRIRGNFILHNYSIVHYVISDNEVYRAINKAGYYSCGIKNENDVTFISIAIPVKTETNPFSNINNDSYLIKSGKQTFYALCVGIDETGEFFINM